MKTGSASANVGFLKTRRLVSNRSGPFMPQA
jgi:hypothetical protein